MRTKPGYSWPTGTFIVDDEYGQYGGVARGMEQGIPYGGWPKPAIDIWQCAYCGTSHWVKKEELQCKQCGAPREI